MIRTCLVMTAVATTAYCLCAATATAATGRCNSLQARCAVEVGGQCDPQTGHWHYGSKGLKSHDTNIMAFDACIARGLAGHK